MVPFDLLIHTDKSRPRTKIYDRRIPSRWFSTSARDVAEWTVARICDVHCSGFAECGCGPSYDGPRLPADPASRPGAWGDLPGLLKIYVTRVEVLRFTYSSRYPQVTVLAEGDLLSVLRYV